MFYTEYTKLLFDFWNNYHKTCDIIKKNVEMGEYDMQRTIYAYELKFEKSRGKDVVSPESYIKDMAETLVKINDFIKEDKTDKHKSDKKILYINNVSYDEDTKTLELIFISARYGIVRKVMNTETYIDKGILKEKPDGDLEKTHVLIKMVEDDCAIALYEYNKDGIGFSKIVTYMNHFIKECHKANKDMTYYKMAYKNIVSRDFLKSLEKLNRIKAVTLTVDQEDVGVSEMKAFAGRRDISGDVDIVLKPTGKGCSIFGNTVKEFYNIYNNKSIPIKRITVEGDRATKDPLVFDTEKMKEKYPVDVLEESNGEVVSFDIFREMETISHYF